MDKRLRKIPAVRKCVQVLSGLLQNMHLSGFVTGAIYTGPLKRFCVPGMNCYSCPAASGACPVGSLQAVLGARRPRVPFYVLGFLAAAGILLGRFVCGWFCLFGLVQELLYKVPLPKLTVPAKADRVLRYLKYVMLFCVVLLLPVILRDEYGIGAPYFCKYFCPAGMLEGGIPLLLLNKALRPAAHFLYLWRLAILGGMLVSAMVVHRPFCRYFCPLGAFYALFQKISILRMQVDDTACVRCGRCASVCPMQADPLKNANSAECIRCGACANACPKSAIRFGFGERNEYDQKRIHNA